MANFAFHTPDSAPAESRPVLTNALERFGFVPNLYAGLAAAPPVLHAYLELAQRFATTSLSPVEREVVSLAASARHQCSFCVAAHSMLAEAMVGAPAEVVAALREGREPDDPKLAALAAFARTMVEERGWVAEHPAYRRFLAAGYTQAQALEVLLGVTQKVLSNYANHLMGTEINEAFAGYRWEP